MAEIPKQVAHAPVIQDFLDKLVVICGVGEPDVNQTTKNPDCSVPAGSLECLNAASCLCERCEWWVGVSKEAENYWED